MTTNLNRGVGVPIKDYYNNKFGSYTMEKEVYELPFKISIVKGFERKKCGHCKKDILAMRNYLHFKVNNAELILCYPCIGSIVISEVKPEEIKQQIEERTNKDVAEAL